MNTNILEEKIYDRYIRPTRRKAGKVVGVEIEMPIVNLTGDAVDFNVVHNLGGTEL